MNPPLLALVVEHVPDGIVAVALRAPAAPFTWEDLARMPDDGYRRELVLGAVYREVAAVSGDEPFEATRPFPVTVVPAPLIR